jgi:hypothetical protein
MALNAGTKTRLLIWRPRLTHPYESAPFLGLVGQPGIAVLPSHSGERTTFKLGIDQGRRAQTRH